MQAHYGKLTWEEVRDADKDRVVILPVAATEDHGPHMPLDTDTLLGTRIVEAVAEKAPYEVLVMPTIPYGFNEHHKDFPGVIWIQPETLIAFVTRCHQVARPSRLPPHPASEQPRVEPSRARSRGAQDGHRDRGDLRLRLLLEPDVGPDQRDPQVAYRRHRTCR